MIILSNCLTDTADEGCLKLATSLIKRLKSSKVKSTLITYERESSLSDVHLNINKLMLNMQLFRIIRSSNESVLYVPFSARQNFSAVRFFILSLVAGRRLHAVITLNRPYNFLGKLFLKLSRVNLITFSEDSYKAHADIINKNRIIYLKTGVDTNKFTPVSKEESDKLKAKYNLDITKPVVLHVGHIKSGRNVAQLMKVNDCYQVVLVSSTSTANEQDDNLKSQLDACPNIKIIDTFQPNIEEIYQLSDVYFFPVVETANCIDVPLSCMEAASCNKPIVTTDYAEMKAFKGLDSFYYIDDFNEHNINTLIKKAVSDTPSSRKSVMSYDWDKAVNYIIDKLN